MADEQPQPSPDERIPEPGLRVNDHVRAYRLSVCHSCEHLKDVVVTKVCGKCGCVVAWKTWLNIPGGGCPIGKWK